MGFWEKLFSKRDAEEPVSVSPRKSEEQLQVLSAIAEDEYDRAGLTYPVSDEEKEEVSAIVSAIVSGDRPDSTIRIRRVAGIDSEKLAAGLIATAVAAADKPHAVFRLNNVSEAKI